MEFSFALKKYLKNLFQDLSIANWLVEGLFAQHVAVLTTIIHAEPKLSFWYFSRKETKNTIAKQIAVKLLNFKVKRKIKA